MKCTVIDKWILYATNKYSLLSHYSNKKSTRKYWYNFAFVMAADDDI